MFRFTLGDRLEMLALDILEHLIEAQYRSKKPPLLHATNIRLERLRFLVRLAKERPVCSIASGRARRE